MAGPETRMMIEWLTHNLTQAAKALLFPLYEFLVDGKSRYFWLYCVSGIAITLYCHARNKGRAPGERELFDREVWLGKSARNDYAIVLIGAALQLSILSWAYLNWKPISAYVVAVMQGFGVTGHVTDGAAVGLGLLLTVTLFIADDFMRWALHTMMHKVPELWEFHKVHHSAEELNFATADRNHPVETIITTFACMLVVGIINGLFIGAFGEKLTVATVFGANIFVVVFNVAGGVLRHSPAWISFGPSIERWVISPAMHQIHHSNNANHFDKNMGGALSVWDRMFGTIYIPKSREIEGFGIGEETADFRSLRVIYFRPFERAADILKARFGISSSEAQQRTPIIPAE